MVSARSSTTWSRVMSLHNPSVGPTLAALPAQPCLCLGMPQLQAAAAAAGFSRFLGCKQGSLPGLVISWAGWLRLSLAIRQAVLSLESPSALPMPGVGDAPRGAASVHLWNRATAPSACGMTVRRMHPGMPRPLLLHGTLLRTHILDTRNEGGLPGEAKQARP